MPEQPLQENKQEFLESDIKRVTEELQKHLELPEGHAAETRAPEGQELVKKSIQSMVTAPPPPPPQKREDGGILPDYTTDAPAGAKMEIEHLVTLAFTQGIDKANSEAVKSDNPFVMDAFHDALAAKLYPELQKRGILK